MVFGYCGRFLSQSAFQDQGEDVFGLLVAMNWLMRCLEGFQLQRCVDLPLLLNGMA